MPEYELLDGTVLGGEAARYCRWLDRHDPLSNRYRSDTELGTAMDLAAANPEARWCEESRRMVLPTGLGNFFEAPRERLLSMLSVFCHARLSWAQDQAARAEAENDEGRARQAAAYAKFCRRACSSGSISGAASLFCFREVVRASMLNTEPAVIGTPDGVVDMDLLELMDPEEGLAQTVRVTKRTRATIDSWLNPSLSHDERWDEFVDEIMCGDAERAAYLQRALGYSAFGGNPEECMFVAFGATTRNGKGTLMESVAWALGDYAVAVDHDYLMERRGAGAGSADEETASLDGVRLVTISEPTKGKRMDEARVKMLTGGDSVSCRHLYGPQFTFRPQFTMWMSCNRLPVVGDATVFRSGRVRVIPFERHFEDGEQDPGLKARFREPDGMMTILEWLIEGYREYRRIGLAEPASVRAATAKYADVGGSTLARFVDECCEVRGDGRMEVPDFNLAYRAFCEEMDEPPLTSQRIRREFEEMGITKRKRRGTMRYAGIALNESGVSYALLGSGTETEANLPPSKAKNAPLDPEGGGGHRIHLG